MKLNLPRHPDCLKCVHFFVTYEPRTPKGCKAYGFKSREMPALVVYSSSGVPCRLFKRRIPKHNGIIEDKVDLS